MNFRLGRFDRFGVCLTGLALCLAAFVCLPILAFALLLECLFDILSALALGVANARVPLYRRRFISGLVSRVREPHLAAHESAHEENVGPVPK